MATVRNKILIVEDDMELLEVLTKKFEIEEEFTVFQAGDGRAGLELALKEHPELILLDIIMPIMDGMTMLRKLREDAWGKDTPVILLTNLSDESKVAEAIKHGAYDYLVKADWKIDDVVKKVRERLK